MKKITLFLLLLTLTAFSQEKYILKTGLPDMTVGDMLKHADSLFNPETNFSFNCTTNYLLPYDKIAKDPGSKPGYADDQLKLIAKDSLQPFAYGNLGLYYENKGEGELARQYYTKALEKVKYMKVEKDSAKVYSYKGYLKFHLGEDGGPDMEKAITINKKDSLAVCFYPMYLITSQKYEQAEKVLVRVLEDDNNKYFGYLMLYMSKAFDAIGKSTAAADGDMGKAFAQFDVQTFVDMRPYQKYFKKSDEDFVLLREMSDMFGVTIKMLGTLQDKNHKLAAADLALVEKKEQFFKSRLKKKNANLYGLYMSLGTTSMAKRDFAAAVDYFQKAIDDFPVEKESVTFNRLDAYYNIATIHIYLKEYDKALAVLKTVPDTPVLPPNTKAKALLDMGKLYYLKNDPETAADYADQSLSITESFEGDMFLGYMYIRQKLNTIGMRYSEKAQKLSYTPDNLSTTVNYYMVLHIANGNFDEAVNIYEGNKELIAGNCKSCEYLIKHYLVAK